jgi:outer membrane protein assembly factor BamB
MAPERAPLVWKTNGIGDGYSSVAVVAGRITPLEIGADSSFVFALDAEDGKPVWAAKLGRRGRGGSQVRGPRSTPTVDGSPMRHRAGRRDCLFRHRFGQGNLAQALVADLGGVAPRGVFRIGAGRRRQVVVTPGGSEGSIVALDKKNGSVVWRSKEFTDPPHYSSVILEEIGGVKQYIQLTAASVAGVSAADEETPLESARRRRWLSFHPRLPRWLCLRDLGLRCRL